MENWGCNSIVHIHTLNHDLFFEVFKSSDWLKGELSDGFKELGSPYYGGLRDRFKVRLPYFANKFDTKFRLYKLHRSVDQYPFHLMESGIDTYIKIKPGVSNTDLFKEIQNEYGEFKYINDWINYHSDFLSGTTSKILRYREPWYYEKVFKHFEQNLENSEILVVVGYGCGDTEINDIIEKHFEAGKNIFIVEPYPHEGTKVFCERFKAKLIIKNPENMCIEDFE